MRARRRRRPARTAALLGVAAVAAIGVTSFFVLRTDDEPVARKIVIDGRPSAVAVAAGLVWVTDDESHVVHIIDPQRNAVVGEPIEVARNPIAIAGDDRAVWVAHATGSVVRIDVDTHTAGTPTETGGSLTGIAVTDGRVWATDNEQGELVEIDPRGPRLLDRVDLDDGAVRVAVAGDSVWVTGQEDTVTPVARRTKKVGPAVRVGAGPIGLIYDGELVWVANSDDDTVTAIDATEAEVVGSAPVGNAPVAIAATEDAVWVANQDDGTLSRVDRRTRTAAKVPVDLGMRPRSLAAGGQVVWVVGTNRNLVVRVDI